MAKVTIKQILKDLEELQPKNIVDYILRGSAFTRLVKKYKVKMK